MVGRHTDASRQIGVATNLHTPMRVVPWTEGCLGFDDAFWVTRHLLRCVIQCGRGDHALAPLPLRTRRYPAGPPLPSADGNDARIATRQLETKGSRTLTLLTAWHCWICDESIPNPDASNIGPDSHMAFVHGLVATSREHCDGVRVDGIEHYIMCSPAYSLGVTMPNALPLGSYHTWNMVPGNSVEMALLVEEFCNEDGCGAKRQPPRPHCAMH